MDITEDVIKLIAQTLLRGSDPSGIESGALQGCILEFVKDGKKLCISVETFVDWMANKNKHGRHIVHLCLAA